MKRLIAIGLLAAAMLSYGFGKKSVVVNVSNPSSFDRSAEMVEIPASAVKVKAGKIPVVRNSKDEVVPSQVTYDGKLIFQSGVKANGTEQFTVTAGKPQEFEPKTFCKFMPERLDDFMWENDRVAFRIYGPALIGKDGPSNGIDVLYKRSDKMVVYGWIERYLRKEGSYHDDHGEGLDDYKVGRGLGAGAMAPYVNGELILNSNFETYEILDNGPLRCTFRLTYKDIGIDGTEYPETRIFSLDAGAQLTKVVQEYVGLNKETPVAAGYRLRDINTEPKYEAGQNWIMLEEPATKKSSGVFLGLVFPKGIGSVDRNMYEIPKGEKNAGIYEHLLAVTTYHPGKPVEYYTGFGWEKFGYPTADSFKTYLENFSSAIATPLTIEY